MTPKFLLVQFNQGAAGKFLLSLLMGSNSVAHFNSCIEEHKDNQSLLKYVKNSFQSFDRWIATEPNPVPAWNIHWISNKMPRGNNQTVDEFNKQLQSDASEYFWQSVNNNKYILILTNKTVLPLAYQHLTPIVIINDKPSLTFLRKSIWVKHYKIKDHKIYLKINDPDMYPEPTKSIMKKFDNPIFSNDSVFSFYRRVIWKNPNTNFFSESKNFSKGNFINLSELLNIDKLVPAMDRLCNELAIDPIDKHFIQQAHAYWIKLHNFRFQ
jgi:hypothetical protein